MQFYKEQAYLLMELSNHSKASFIQGKLNVALQTKKQWKRHSRQRQDLNLAYQIHMPAILKPGEIKRFVLILLIFTIPEKWVLNISVQEQHGCRHLGVLSSSIE